MAKFQRRLRSALALCLMGLALSGCAQGFPKRYSWYGHHPALYGMAFSAAATEAVVKEQFGEDYYTHLGDAAYTPGLGGFCNNAQWNNYFVRKNHAACTFIGQKYDPTCLNINHCAILQFDPALFDSLNARRVVERALADPCSHLTHPDQAGANRSEPTRLGMSADENWKVLQCSGNRVVGKVIWFDADQGSLLINFEEQSRA